MRLVGYVRVSTDRQAEDGRSLVTQRASIEAYCVAMGHELVGVECDEGESGARVSRPALDRALALIDSGAADALVFYQLDRVTRSIAHFCALAESYKLVSVREAIDTTTPVGELAANMLACFAQFERRRISQRTKTALARKRAQGVVLGRPAAFTPAQVVRARELVGGGASLREAARAVAAEFGVACDAHKVKRMLR